MTRKAIAPIPSWLALFASFLGSPFASSMAFAAECDPIVATAVSVQGKVEVRRVEATQWQPVALNDTFCSGDRIRVGDRSRADVALANQPVLRLDQNTTITLGGIQKEQPFLVDLVQGATYFFSRATRALEVRTAFVNAGVEGTEGLIRVGDNGTEITIFEGKVVAANDAGTLSLTGGESAVAVSGQAPAYRTIVKPRDAVHWALYYPPVMDIPPEDFAGRETNDPRVLARRAASSLAVGRVDEASADLERALKLDPKNSEALALQSIIAITQNDKVQGLALAQQAVQADPQSATALLAMSYAQQAQFDLEGARNSLLSAVKANPNDALAWARLAEIQMSFQEMDKALEAAKKAVELNPDLARTQTVLGFAYLMQVKTSEAREAFIKAHELDQADALPKLGLGLAKIRDGEVEEGRAELEIAASLDPDNAIVRSYLGKAFFEEKRDAPTEREYDIAKELDPQDPTPYFYHALQKQLTNRPVEALQDMETAIELNDNRAVYRSKLSLDSDLAARSASLGRIYGNLGFQQLALVEGWLSVNTDDTNFSGHRFLADSYAVLPRHEIARVSELFRSQMLQPLNITPIQPRLAESNLFLLGAQGPGALSFNEFNTLMVNRNRLAVLGSGVVGENSTYAGEGVVAGIYKQASFSVGYTHFETDGFRTNANQNDDVANAFVQVELSPQTSVQTEYRYRNTKRGDLQLNFFRDDFRANVKEKTETNLIRTGLRHNFSPDSILLSSFMYQHRKDSLKDKPSDPFVTSIFDDFPDQDAYSGELQHLFRSQYINLTSGFGQFNIDSKPESTVTFNLPSPPFPPPPQIDSSEFNENVQHTNLYVYSYITPLNNLTITLGASEDLYHTRSNAAESKNQFNPKFGMVWNPFPATTLRAAAFRTLKRTLIANQTLEPTQVAGFNQFFDDVNGSSAWRYGGAINQKFSKNVFAGGEFSKRDLTNPFEEVTINGSKVERGNSDEYLGRGYLFWTPHPWLALSAEYQYEEIKNENDVAFFYTKVRTHRVPLGLGVFHPSGLSARLRGTYFNQNGDFIQRGGTSFESEQSDFWIFDAEVSYRLPKRYGLFTVGVTNLFDNKFDFQETDIRNPTVQPDRLVFGQLTMALP